MAQFEIIAVASKAIYDDHVELLLMLQAFDGSTADQQSRTAEQQNSSSITTATAICCKNYRTRVHRAVVGPPYGTFRCAG